MPPWRPPCTASPLQQSSWEPTRVSLFLPNLSSRPEERNFCPASLQVPGGNHHGPEQRASSDTAGPLRLYHATFLLFHSRKTSSIITCMSLCPLTEQRQQHLRLYQEHKEASSREAYSIHASPRMGLCHGVSKKILLDPVVVLDLALSSRSHPWPAVMIGGDGPGTSWHLPAG